MLVCEHRGSSPRPILCSIFGTGSQQEGALTMHVRETSLPSSSISEQSQHAEGYFRANWNRMTWKCPTTKAEVLTVHHHANAPNRLCIFKTESRLAGALTIWEHHRHTVPFGQQGITCIRMLSLEQRRQNDARKYTQLLAALITPHVT